MTLEKKSTILIQLNLYSINIITCFWGSHFDKVSFNVREKKCLFFYFKHIFEPMYVGRNNTVPFNWFFDSTRFSLKPLTHNVRKHPKYPFVELRIAPMTAEFKIKGLYWCMAFWGAEQWEIFFLSINFKHFFENSHL